MRDSSEDLNLRTLSMLHDAWSRADVEMVLACVTDDLSYWSNIGNGADPLILLGKEAFRGFMETIVTHYACASAVAELKWRQGRAHVRIVHSVSHRQSGHTLRGAFRQIATFRDNRIERIEEYYDAAKLLAFRRLVNGS